MRIVVDRVAFEYPGRRILDTVTFEVAPGHLLGIIGPNGAGKSTLLRCMHKALVPQRGSVLVGDADLGRLSSREVARRVGVVPQSCSPAFRVTVAEFVGMGRFARESFLGSPSAADRDVVRRALASVGMQGFAERWIQDLSGGEFRHVLIAQALAQETPVLLLDEPVQQLDLRHQIEVMELIRGLADRPDAATVTVLHDLGLAARYCDELVLLGDGKVLAAGTPEQVITDENLERAYGVEAAIDRCPATGTIRVVALHAIHGRAHAINDRNHGGNGS